MEEQANFNKYFHRKQLSERQTESQKQEGKVAEEKVRKLCIFWFYDIISSMKIELRSAVDFLTNFIRTSKYVTNEQLSIFRTSLLNLLQRKYENHWFPEKPCKGSGYRCIRLNHNMDPTVREAGLSCGLNQQALEQLLPKELTMWVDPREVSYRLGENGSIGIIFDGTVRINSFNSDLASPASNNNLLQQSCKGKVFISRDNFQQIATLVQG